jgi:hypothetical protein
MFDVFGGLVDAPQGFCIGELDKLRAGCPFMVVQLSNINVVPFEQFSPKVIKPT